MGDQEAAGTPHALRCFHPCLSVCGLHVPNLPWVGVWGRCGGLGTWRGASQQDHSQGVRHTEDAVEGGVLPHDRYLPSVEHGHYNTLSGVFGFALVVILGITSLPSVTATLSWKEFNLVQSGLGWTALVFLCAHDMFYGWPYMNGPSCGIPSSFQYALYVPFLTIIMKLPLVLPPLSTHLTRIRTGYVRAAKGEETA